MDFRTKISHFSDEPIGDITPQWGLDITLTSHDTNVARRQHVDAETTG